MKSIISEMVAKVAQEEQDTVKWWLKSKWVEIEIDFMWNTTIYKLFKDGVLHTLEKKIIYKNDWFEVKYNCKYQK